MQLEVSHPRPNQIIFYKPVSDLGLGVEGTTVSAAQGLFLVLHSGVPPLRSGGTIWGARNKTQVGHMQSNCPNSCNISLDPFFVHVISSDKL